MDANLRNADARAVNDSLSPIFVQKRRRYKPVAATFAQVRAFHLEPEGRKWLRYASWHFAYNDWLNAAKALHAPERASVACFKSIR